MQFSEEEIKDSIADELKIAESKFGKEFKKYLIKILSLEKMLTPTTKENRLIPLTQWSEYHPDPSVKALRMMVFRDENNFVDNCIVYRGKRILINEQNYFKWQAQYKSK